MTDEIRVELVVCARCGVGGQWQGAVVVNAEPHPVAPYCRDEHGRRRSHGPWVPVIP